MACSLLPPWLIYMPLRNLFQTYTVFFSETHYIESLHTWTAGCPMKEVVVQVWLLTGNSIVIHHTRLFCSSGTNTCPRSYFETSSSIERLSSHLRMVRHHMYLRKYTKLHTSFLFLSKKLFCLYVLVTPPPLIMLGHHNVPGRFWLFVFFCHACQQAP